MLRKIFAVSIGIALSFLGSAVGGFLLYRFSGYVPFDRPAVARYLVGPCIVLIVGVAVGLMAESRPALLAGAGLLPWAFTFLLARRQGLEHELLLVFLIVVYICLGMGAAGIAGKIRLRNA